MVHHRHASKSLYKPSLLAVLPASRTLPKCLCYGLLSYGQECTREGKGKSSPLVGQV